jgi:hypothetical protein
VRQQERAIPRILVASDLALIHDVIGGEISLQEKQKEGRTSALLRFTLFNLLLSFQLAVRLAEACADCALGTLI